LAIKFKCSLESVTLFHDELSIMETPRKRKLQVGGKEFVEKFTGTKIEDIPSDISLYMSDLPDNFFPVIAVSLDNSKNGMSILLQLAFTDLDSWIEPYSYGNYINQLDTLIEGQSSAIKRYSKHEGADSAYLAAQGVTFFLERGDVIENILTYAEKISCAQKEAHLRLSDSTPEDTILKIFNFPKGYESICVQYLVWFSDFLAELGIKAQITSEQNGSETKFIVAPENASETLSKVEELFYTYLSLPYAEFLPANNSGSQEQALLYNLQAQVSHFQTQVQLKDSIIELKNETINSMQVRRDEMSQKLVLLESIKEESIELFGGALSIGTIKWGPFKFNPKTTLNKLGHKPIKQDK